MSGQNSSDTKDQPATAHRLKESRKKGQVFQSQDLTSAVALLVTSVALVLALPWMGIQLFGLFDYAVASVPHGQPHTLIAGVWQAGFVWIASSMAVVGAGLVATLLTARVQVGPVFSFEPVRPKMSHINPVTNAKRILSLRSVVLLVMILLKMIVLAIGFSLIVPNVFADAVRVVLGGEGAALAVLARAVLLFMAWGVVAFLILAVLDLAYQRFQFAKDQRMSTRDIKREHKDLEGNPLIKSARKMLQQEPSASENLQYLHLTNLLLQSADGRLIALYYDPGRFEGRPVVIVKASGALASAVFEALGSMQTRQRTDQALVNRLWGVSHNGQMVPLHLSPALIPFFGR